MTALGFLEQKYGELLRKQGSLENEIDHYSDALETAKKDLSQVQSSLEDIEAGIKLLTPQ